jgi:hypothetical protein
MGVARFQAMDPVKIDGVGLNPAPTLGPGRIDAKTYRGPRDFVEAPKLL